MPRASAAKKPLRTGFLEKLDQLRSFVGRDVDEQDLEPCLKLCGCDVNVAAMKLMTGDYKRAAATTAEKRGPSAVLQITEKKPRVSLSPDFAGVQKLASSNKGKAKLTASASLSPRQSAETVVTKDARVINVKSSSDLKPYLLCQRWVQVDSKTKRGHVLYQESLRTTCSQSGPPMVRVQGRNVEGSLPHKYNRIMAPLMRQGLIQLNVESMMEYRGMNIGSEFPVSLRLSILKPREFFRLFDSQSKDAGSASNTYFGNLVAKNKRYRKIDEMDLAICAFDLLQWAHCGDVPEFQLHPPGSANQGNDGVEASDAGESEEEDVLDESAFEVEGEAAEAWAKSVLEAASRDPLVNVEEIPDPPGFVDVQLRPYQRQALSWMWKRETDSSNRDVVEQELKLLSELARNKAKNTQYVDPYQMQEQKAGVSCDRGPVLVSKEAAQKSTTLDGAINPVTHPLWQRRFLGLDDNTTVCFYVNELLGVATAEPPNPPKQCVGGIQADAMGLGKTVMLLALLLKSKQEENSNGQTLVVAPLSLVAQWEEELTSKTNLSSKVYYGENSRRAISKASFDGIDVVVTTYGTIQGELHAIQKKHAKSNGILSHDWFRVILDEAHCIKNAATLCSKACCMLKAKRRWCVTGTPIQNSLQDAYALLKFLRHEPWCESGFWKKAISSCSTQNKIVENGMEIALDRVRRVLSPLILRRSKDTLNSKGEPILILPPLEIKTIDVTLSTPEREFYNALKSKSQSIFEGIIGSGKVTKSYFQIFALLNRLRQACDHVALTVKSQMDDAEWNLTEIDTKVASKSSPKKSPEKDLINHRFVEDLLAKFQTDQSLTDDLTNQEFATQVANQLSQAVSSSSDAIDDECAICLETPKIVDAVVTPCAHVFCSDCLVKVLRAASPSTIGIPDGECPCCKKKIEAKRIIRLFKKDGKTDTRYLLDTEVKVKAEMAADAAARVTLERALKGAGSAKLTAIVEELNTIWKVDPGAKVLIFSQFLGFLDLLQSAMRQQGIPYSRLDGKLTLSERKKVVDTFKESHPSRDGKGSVLLMSMKAGGVGLNLVQASAVFIVDPWWNSAIEDQCIMRCHRIGQMSAMVRVRKFVVKHSVEERIVSLQERKKNMAGQILDGSSDMDNANKATLDDFKLLFGL